MNKHQEIITTLTQCVNACEFCATSCLDEPNVKHMVNCIRLNRDCADVCSLAIHLLSRKSDRSTSIIELCAECAQECSHHDHDHCKKCAEACRKCEQSCRDYLNQQANVKHV